MFPPQCSKLSFLEVFLGWEWGNSPKWLNQVSTLGVSELQVKICEFFGVYWPPCEEQHCLEETGFPLIVRLDVWRPVAATVCREIQHRTLAWWLHPFPGSPWPSKFSSLSQRTDPNTLLDVFCVLTYFGCGEPLCLHFLDCSLVFGSCI
jgi:hypothetical protein